MPKDFGNKKIEATNSRYMKLSKNKNLDTDEDKMLS
jgi:hypothetical protein